jgi:hypothetical protein
LAWRRASSGVGSLSQSAAGSYLLLAMYSQRERERDRQRERERESEREREREGGREHL